MTALVAVASRHGATREIAAAIARGLGEHGIESELADVEDVSRVDRYDAVVLGSAVYVGRWLEPARRFVAEHGEKLASKDVWLFSSGPIGDPPRPVEEEAVQVADLAAATQAREHRLFAGRLDKSGLGFGERAIVAAVRAQEGDFRDWDEIGAWAGSIAAALSR
jgi:menaquinone-dependent protoporphyrinogen oxidase